MSYRPRGRSHAAHPLLRAIEAAWPVLAGTSAAVGLVGSARQYGLVGLTLIYLGTAVFAMVMVYAAYAEGDVSDVPIVRAGLGASLALVVLLGLISLFPIAGGPIALLAAATSPPVTSWLAARRARRGPTPAAAPLVAQDQTMVDRAFEGIVADLEDDQSWRSDTA